MEHLDRSAYELEFEEGFAGPAWRPEDGDLRVSNLQTGLFSGPVGSPRGTHRHVDGLRVVTPQPPWTSYVPSSGMVEATLRATLDPTTMLAFWLVGVEEDSADDSGEVCVVELFGDRIGRERSELSIGVKAHHDPRLHDEMAFVPLELDATAWHTYAAAWDEEAVRFSVDDRLVRTVEQSLTYPQQLMVGLFEFPPGPERDAGSYPKTGEVGRVRGFRR